MGSINQSQYTYNLRALASALDCLRIVNMKSRADLTISADGMFDLCLDGLSEGNLTAEEVATKLDAATVRFYEIGFTG